MEISEIRVRNYRTIGSEQTLRLGRGAVLVGPNNSGKTNLLKAIQLLFTSPNNRYGYRRDSDLTFGAGRNQTSLAATFVADPGDARDRSLLAVLDDLHDLVGTTRSGQTVPLYLNFSPSDRPVYKAFPNVPIPEANRPNFSRKQQQYVDQLISRFVCHYVPSAKSVVDLYEDVLRPFLVNAAIRAVEPHLTVVSDALREIGATLTTELAEVGLSDLRASFTMPGDDPANLVITGFDFILEDPARTAIWEKGQGIQSTTLLTSFLWVTRQEINRDVIPIWLIEEPESYLHPELTHASRSILDRLTTEALVVVTTHNLAFVPQDIGRVTGVESGPTGTQLRRFQTHREATARIRDSLGVKFADFYNLGATNVFVEGPTDKSLIQWILGLLDEDDHPLPLLRQAFIEDWGGVKQLEGFLRGAYPFIRTERPTVTLLDGDGAGDKSRQDLQQFFGQREIPFEAGTDFVVVRDRFPIEGLFPDEWVADLHTEHSGWFETYAIDSLGTLQPFRVKDRDKPRLTAALQARADAGPPPDWSVRWAACCDAIEAALASQENRILRATE